MRRRNFFLMGALAVYGQKPREWVTATASRDTAPRVGLIPSTFTGGEEMDGKKIRGLVKPAALTATLTAAQVDDMLRLAVELGGGRRGGLVTAIGREDWVLILAAPGADPRLAPGVLRILRERGLGKRFMVAGMAGLAGVETLDLTAAQRLEMPVEGRVFSRRNPTGVYRIPRALRECDKVISIAGLGRTMTNYLGFAEGGAADDESGRAVDLFGFHPAEYAIGMGRNVIVAGTNATAVDAVGLAVLGEDSTAAAHLERAAQRGDGNNDASSIWTRGAEVDSIVK